MADATCKRGTDTVQRLADLVAAAQVPVIGQYTVRHQGRRAFYDRRRVVARHVLQTRDREP